MDRLWPLQNREHPLCCRIRPPPQGPRRPRHGGIHTELGRHLDADALEALVAQINESAKATGGGEFEFKSIPQGAATSVWAAAVADPNEVGGRYLEDCQVAELADDEGLRAGVRAYALDPDNAKALWAKSEAMVGERF